MVGSIRNCSSPVRKNVHVKLDKHAIIQLCPKIRQRTGCNSFLEYCISFLWKRRITVAYSFLDSINFCFWLALGNPKWEVEYQSGKLSGYFALAASLKKALESGVPLTNAQYLAKLSLKEFKKILGGKGDLQLLELRVRSLNELGQMLMREYQGKAYNLIEAAAQSALQLVRLVAEKLPSFRDSAEYQGKKVFFYKRAQLFVADLSLQCSVKVSDKKLRSFIEKNFFTLVFCTVPERGQLLCY